jgi:hypothetical protein
VLVERGGTDADAGSQIGERHRCAGFGERRKDAVSSVFGDRPPERFLLGAQNYSSSRLLWLAIGLHLMPNPASAF